MSSSQKRLCSRLFLGGHTIAVDTMVLGSLPLTITRSAIGGNAFAIIIIFYF